MSEVFAMMNAGRVVSLMPESGTRHMSTGGFCRVPDRARDMEGRLEPKRPEITE